MAADYHELGFLSRDIDVRPIAPKLEAFFEPRLAPARAAAISFKTIVDGLTEVVFQNYPFTVPAFYALVVRSLVNLEGLALSIDEDYRVLEAAYPYVARRILLDSELRSSLMELLFSSLPSTGAATFASFRWDRAANLLRESSKSSISVPGKTADGRSDDTALLVDLASSLIEEEAFRRTLLAELASTADVMIADMIGGAVAGITGDEPASADFKRTLGLGSEDEAKVSKVKETVNLIAEKVADRIPNGLDAVGWAAQAAAGALQDMVAPGESTSQPQKKGPAPTPDAMAGEFLEQLRERAAVRTLKALANLLGSEDDGRSAGGGPQRGRGVTR
ncbi:ABC1K3 [Symbiodinium sp. CCMP2456]|nr:ABC1K3 [Symbiodinium sp. CCMP2456]